MFQTTEPLLYRGIPARGIAVDPVPDRPGERARNLVHNDEKGEMNMKKLLAVILALTMALSLAACVGGETAEPADSDTAASDTTAPAEEPAEESAETATADDESTGDVLYRIGICQQMQHPSLDEATQGFEDALTELLGSQVTFDYQNAGGEQSNCTSIVSKFVTDDVDLIMANATIAVQCAKEATTTIPVVGTSVTDYVSTGIVDSNEAPGANVTGYSDLSDDSNHVALLQELLPDTETVAIVRSSGEENSRIQAETAAAAFEAAGITTEEFTANDSNDISAVVTEACSRADAIYIPTDNLFAGNMQLVKNVALNQKVPVISSFTAEEDDGALLSISISYYTMGHLAGEMAYEILVNGADPAEMPIGVMTVDDMTVVINQSVADELGVTIPESMQDYVA